MEFNYKSKQLQHHKKMHKLVREVEKSTKVYLPENPPFQMIWLFIQRMKSEPEQQRQEIEKKRRRAKQKSRNSFTVAKRLPTVERSHNFRLNISVFLIELMVN